MLASGVQQFDMKAGTGQFILSVRSVSLIKQLLHIINRSPSVIFKNANRNPCNIYLVVQVIDIFPQQMPNLLFVLVYELVISTEHVNFEASRSFTVVTLFGNTVAAVAFFT